MSYPVALMLRVRALRKAEWTYREIQDLVHRETGHRPSLNTVHRWADPAFAKRKDAAARGKRRATAAAGANTGGRLGSSRYSDAYQEHRARRLVLEAGMSHTATARAMAFDFPDQGWTTYRVARLVGDARFVRPCAGPGRPPKLTAGQIVEIRGRAAEGYRPLAREFGVSDTTIRNLILGRPRKVVHA